MLIFSLEFPASGLGFPHHLRGPLSQRPTKRVRIWAWHFLWRPVRGLGFPQHTRTPLSVTHQNRVCPVSVGSRACGCIAYFDYGSIWLPVTWVITRHRIKQDLG